MAKQNKPTLRARWKQLLKDLEDVDYEFRMAIVEQADQSRFNDIGARKRGIMIQIRAHRQGHTN